MKINAKARLRSLYEPKQVKMLETEKPEEPVKPNVPEKPVAPTKPTKPVEPVKPESVGEQDKEKPVEATVSIQCPNCLDNPEWVKGHRDVLTRGRFWKCGSCNHTISRPPYKLNQD